MHDRKAYRTVERIPPESNEDDANGSDDEWNLRSREQGSVFLNYAEQY